MARAIKYIVIAAILGITLYNAVYIEPLDDVKKKQEKTVFNAKAYANAFMSDKIESLSSTKTSDFLSAINNNVTSYAEQHGKKLGISTDYYFLIDGDASVTQIEEENVLVSLLNNNQQNIRIATDFIFGNAIREASAMANIGDYQNTMDYNNISVELNNIVRETIIPPFVENVKTGDTLYFKGAVKVNTKKPNLTALRIIPLQLKLKN